MTDQHTSTSSLRAAIQAVADNVKALNEKLNRSTDDRELRERVSLAAVIATAIVAFLTLLIFARQLAEMQKVYEPISKQSTTTERQTEILRKQAELQQGQLAISEQQTALLKLQYLPAFSIAIDSPTTNFRIVDILNAGAAVDHLDAQMFSTLRVDFRLPAGNRKQTSYFGLMKGDRFFGPIQRDLVAQFKTTISRTLIDRLQTIVEQKLRQTTEFNRWKIERVAESDWVFVEYNTRDDYGRKQRATMMTDPSARISHASIGVTQVFLEASYYDNYIKGDLEVGEAMRLSDFFRAPEFAFGADMESAAQFLFDYLVLSRDCSNFHLLEPRDQVSSTISNLALSYDNADVREPISRLIQPATCTKLNSSIRKDPQNLKRSWKIQEAK